MDPCPTPASCPSGRPDPCRRPARGDFQTCPLLYRFRVIDRLPEPLSPPALRGTLVHEVLEAIYDLPRERRTLEEAVMLVAPQWERRLAEEPGVADELVARGRTCRGGWPGSAIWSRPTSIWRILGIWSPPPGSSGWRRSCSPAWSCADSSTGWTAHPTVPCGSSTTRRAARPDQGFEARAMFQMRFYALVLWRMHGRVPDLLQLMYLSTGVVLRYQPDEADLLATERKIEALWRAIDQASRTGDFRPNPSSLCDWCATRPSVRPSVGPLPRFRCLT